MPFSDDKDWPAGLRKIFNISRQRNVPFEARYYGPYDRLFNYAIVEGSFDFFLAPQAPPNEAAPRDAVDFVVLVVLNEQQQPVLVAEVKDDNWANQPDTRLKADIQLRERFDQMLRDCPIPNLYGLSLLGTSLRIYCGNTATRTITPPSRDRPDKDRTLPSEFLEGEWDLDILSEDGFNKIKEIVQYIKVEAAKL